MKTQRFNIPEEWRRNPSMPSNPLFPFNFAYKGLTDLTSELIHIFSDKKSIPKTMIEIGSYMGESTMIFASSGIFETIHSIEPHQGIEIFSEQYQYTWKDIEKGNKEKRCFLFEFLPILLLQKSLIDFGGARPSFVQE